MTDTRFATGDRVLCKAKNRRHGVVRYVYCNECTDCKDKRCNLCVAPDSKKTFVCASFTDDHGSKKSYRYENHELEREAPLPLKPEERVIDWSAKDIQPLGSMLLDVPLIVAEDAADSEAEEETETAQNDTTPDVKPNMGMFFDAYAGMSSRMERPV
jgi:hypothetical protein